ncbi:FecR family protein [Pedobacter ginsengisoli]|uniref:FecR family protein n=1 Tax=Pedobacter ginsengisoli TaxID=363852 RepID=UPI00254E7E3C|nr:FecR domain-containing protein [Pedobacter ginsengisoli]
MYNESFNTFQKDEETWAQIQLDPVVLEQKSWNQIYGNIQSIEKPVIKLWPRIAVAAAAVAAVVFGVYFFNANRHANTPRHPELVSGPQDIAPGKNGATITLANGKVIALSDAKSGVVVGGGKLAYYPSLRGGTTKQSPLHDEIASIPRNDGEGKQQITASTAKGQTYQFTLPDGTKVWLNADSKISFPSQFSGKQRKVLLEGEGYFEVSKNKAKPFIVQTDKQEVTVLGTHFNINAYSDDTGIKTTLVEGSVRVRHLEGSASTRDLLNSTNKGSLPVVRDDGNAVTLKPNQQALVTVNQPITVKEINAADAIDWKNGEFVFRKEPLQQIMKRVERWYNVKVIYKGDMKPVTFSGTVSRFDKASTLLRLLEKTKKIHFDIVGNSIIITNPNRSVN